MNANVFQALIKQEQRASMIITLTLKFRAEDASCASRRKAKLLISCETLTLQINPRGLRNVYIKTILLSDYNACTREPEQGCLVSVKLRGMPLQYSRAFNKLRVTKPKLSNSILGCRQEGTLHRAFRDRTARHWSGPPRCW